MLLFHTIMAAFSMLILYAKNFLSLFDIPENSVEIIFVI